VAKLTDRLETLTKYQTEMESLEAQVRGIQAKQAEVAKAFAEWMTSEFGFGDGPQGLPKILKTVLESSIEPKPQIIT
jgi:hypothetical protein